MNTDKANVRRAKLLLLKAEGILKFHRARFARRFGFPSWEYLEERKDSPVGSKVWRIAASDKTLLEFEEAVHKAGWDFVLADNDL